MPLRRCRRLPLPCAGPGLPSHSAARARFGGREPDGGCGYLGRRGRQRGPGHRRSPWRRGRRHRARAQARAVEWPRHARGPGEARSLSRCSSPVRPCTRRAAGHGSRAGSWAGRGTTGRRGACSCPGTGLGIGVVRTGTCSRCRFRFRFRFCPGSRGIRSARVASVTGPGSCCGRRFRCCSGTGRCGCGSVVITAGAEP